MNSTTQTNHKALMHEVKMDIKQLYKKYDEHLNRITLLDSLLNDEASEAQTCVRKIQERSRRLNELEERGEGLPASKEAGKFNFEQTVENEIENVN